jgi:tetratricopeptide (TPR) repeat protein
MARGKQKDRKAPKGTPATGGRTYTPEQLVEQANVALGNMELELAAEFYNRALEMSPNDTNIMDALADVKMQLGDTEKALELLVTSTIMAPNVNPFKWFFLGQMQFEFDAVNSYRKGIQILTQQLKTETDVRYTAVCVAAIAVNRSPHFMLSRTPER